MNKSVKRKKGKGKKGKEQMDNLIYNVIGCMIEIHVEKLHKKHYAHVRSYLKAVRKQLVYLLILPIFNWMHEKSN